MLIISVTRKEEFMSDLLSSKIEILEQLFDIAKINNLYEIRNSQAYCEDDEFYIKFNLNIQLANATLKKLGEVPYHFKEFDLEEQTTYIFTESTFGNGFLEFQPHSRVDVPNATPFWESSEGVEMSYDDFSESYAEDGVTEEEYLREIREMFGLATTEFLNDQGSTVDKTVLEPILDFYIDYGNINDCNAIFQVIQCSKLYHAYGNFKYNYMKKKGRKNQEVIDMISHIDEINSYICPCNHQDVFPEIAESGPKCWLFICGYFDGYCECTDISNMNVFTAFLANLQDLLIFKLDEKFHFLPDEFRNGDRLIYPNFTMEAV